MKQARYRKKVVNAALAQFAVPMPKDVCVACSQPWIDLKPFDADHPRRICDACMARGQFSRNQPYARKFDDAAQPEA